MTEELTKKLSQSSLSPGEVSPSIKRTPSSSRGHLNADVQARLKAFQEQRLKKSQEAAAMVDSSTKVNKPLPPLPPSETPGAGSLPSQSGRLLPNRAAPPAPKQSLSARRGMKLNAPSLNLGRTPPGALPPAGPLPSGAGAPVTAMSASAEKRSNPGSNPGSLISGISVTKTNFANNAGSSAGGLFTSFQKYVDIKSGSLNFAGKLSLSSTGVDFSNGSSFHISLDQLEFLGELGRGNYGQVTKVLHKPTNIIMAMKEVRLELDESKFTQILMELDVLHKCQSPYIVDFYGAFFVEGAVYMCMEYMDGGSLDKVYAGGVPEAELAVISKSVIEGLRYLKDGHNIIHRDVKPTNILVSTSGKVKLCDFGVSGNLVASLAKTNIGCQSYMAPERIKSLNPDTGAYSVQSDVWSLGLTILEVALGSYPYPPETYDNIFSQLSAIVDGPPPSLPKGIYSSEAQDFVNQCLQKNPGKRPSYGELLKHPWMQFGDVDMAAFIKDKISHRSEQEEKKKPALHAGGLTDHQASNEHESAPKIEVFEPSIEETSTASEASVSRSTASEASVSRSTASEASVSRSTSLKSTRSSITRPLSFGAAQMDLASHIKSISRTGSQNSTHDS